MTTDPPSPPPAEGAPEPGGAPRAARSARAGQRARLLWPLGALVALLLADTIHTHDFLSIQIKDGHLYGSPVDILRNGSPLLLVSLGMTLVIATRGIDLSVGAILAIAGAVACKWIADSPHPGRISTVLVAVGLACLAAAALGLVNGVLVAVIGIQPIIATLILLTAGRGMAMLITSGEITSIVSDPYASIGGGYWFGLPAAVIISGLILAVLAVAVRRTALGMLVEAVGINPEASRLAGVGAAVIGIAVYTLSGLFSGIAGVMVSSNVMVSDANNAGLFIELDAILAVVLGGTLLAGGTFSLVGTLVGVLVIQTLSITVTILGISSSVTPLFKAVVVIAVFLLQSPVTRSRLGGRRRTTAAAATRVVTAP